MGLRGTIRFVSATAGTGKTYRRAPDFVIRKFLVENTGVHYSNFPWRFEDWQEGEKDKNGNPLIDESGAPVLGPVQPGFLSVAEEITKLPREEIARRVQVIPHEVTESWRLRRSGPWEYFKDMDLSAAHIALDEIHNFCPAKNASKQVKGTEFTWEQTWQNWLGELRHRGATLECISQTPKKVSSVIKDEAELQGTLVSCESDHDFFFGIPMYDWYQLRAKLTGKWQATVWERWRRQIESKWKVISQEKFVINPKWFTTYDSFSAPHAGGKAGMTEMREWQRYGWMKLLLWFLFSHWWRLLIGRYGGIAGTAFVIWLAAFGGSQVIFASYFGLVQSIGVKQPEKKEGDGKTAYSRQFEAGKKSPMVIKEKSPVKVAAGALVPLPAGVAGAVESVPDGAAAAVSDLQELWRVGVLMADRVVFCSGDEFPLLHTFSEGPYLGQQIKAIDDNRRSLVLASGRVLRLGLPADADLCKQWVLRSTQTASGGSFKSGPAISEPLPRVGEGPEKSPGVASAPREKSYAERVRDAAAGVSNPAGSGG